MTRLKHQVACQVCHCGPVTSGALNLSFGRSHGLRQAVDAPSSISSAHVQIVDVHRVWVMRSLQTHPIFVGAGEVGWRS